MKFFASVFLLILGPFSLIKTVFNLSCYGTDDYDTDGCTKELLTTSRADINDKLLSKMFGCLRSTTKEIKATCESNFTACVTLTTELKDQTQLLGKGCGNPGDGQCDEEITSTYRKLTRGKPDFVKTTHCDYCSSDNCNNQRPKSNPHLPSLAAIFSCPEVAIYIIVSITLNL